MKLPAATIFSTFLLLSACQGYRILGVFPLQARSHFVMFEHLMKGLARKGHQVDVISTFPLKKPYENYTDLIVLPVTRPLVNNFTYVDITDLLATMTVRAITTLAGNDVCDFLGHPEVQKLLRDPPKDPPYDAVIVEVFGARCTAVIGHVLNVPMIGVTTATIYPWSNDIIANPENLAFVSNNLIPLTPGMNFWQRVYNVVHSVFTKAYFYHATKTQDDIVRKYLGDGLPSVDELERQISIILVNSHMSVNGMRPMTPALIEVGGLHVQDEDAELPKALKKWMDESKDGIVYFSFGSMVTIESFPTKYLEIFYKSLGKIAPVRVLLKIPKPNELPPGLPNNVLTQPWMSQIKVLKHPNVRAFITHGGLMGTQEAIHYGVPMIGIPLFGDQFVNVATCVYNNLTVKLDLHSLTEEKMDEALNTILNNPLYRDTARKISAKFLDRPTNVVDTATYWVEYVIKHGSDALRSPALDLYWWQVQLLDVYAFLLFSGIIAIVLLFKIQKHLLSSFVRGRTAPRVSRAKKTT